MLPILDRLEAEETVKEKGNVFIQKDAGWVYLQET
jgi:hypothetical protein